MGEGLYGTRIEWNQLVKKIGFLEEYIKNSLKIVHKSKWVKPQEAMELIGCRCTKLTDLRKSGMIDWRYSGNGKGIMILRSSIDRYNMGSSTVCESRGR